MTASFNTVGQFSPKLWALGHWRTRKVIVKAGQVLDEATVLGQITADKKYIKSLAAATDGSQTVDAILAEAVDATGGDKEALIYIAGEFDQDALILGDGHTLGSIDATFRDKSIWLEKPMG